MAYFSARITCSLLSVLMIFSLLLPSIGKAAVGNPLTASIELADGDHDAGFMENASITELANGNFVAVWETRVNTDTTPATSFDGDGDGIFYQIFNSSGVALGPVVTASTTTVLDQESPLAAALADGGFVITWACETVAADADIDARMRVFDNSGTALTSDIDVNESEPTGTIDEQAPQAVLGLANGNFVILYEDDNDNTDNKEDFFVRTFDKNGNPLTASIELAGGSHDAGFMENASITELANGNYVAVWETRVNTDTTPATSFDGDGDGVFYQMFNSSGAALGSVVTASTTTVLDQESPLAAAMADGGFVITWACETVAADADIDARMRVFDNNGTALTSDIDVNESEPTGTIDEQAPQAVLGLANGNFVILYEDDNDNTGNKEDFFVRTFDKNGNPLTVSIELAGGSHDAGFMENASITELANGNFVAVWETRVNTDTTPATSFDGDGDGVFYQMFNSNGAALGSVVTASTTTVLDQESPLAAAFADGGFVITWACETVAADADIDARMRVFDNSGIALTSDIDVNESEPTGTIDEQAPQAVLGLANGNFVILYEDDNDNTGNKEDFFVRTFEGNSSPPVVTLALSGSPLSEDGGVATVSADLSASSGQDVTVTLAFSGTAADGGTDYTASATSIVIPGGSLSGSITLTAVADTLDETDETIIVDITAVTNATESGSQQVIATITDDDLPPTVTLALTGSPLPENTGIAAVSADLSIASGRDVTVTLALSGTASPGGIDYTASGLFIVISAGSLSGSITLSSVNDLLDEVDETVIIDITTVTNGTESGTQQVTAIITDDDTPPTVTLALSGDPLAENGGVALVIAELSTMSGRAVTVTLALSGTASGEGTDYTASGTSILIPAGNLSANISLTADDDALDEVNETIIVNITAVTNGTESGSQQITATITDDDPPPTATLALTGSPLAENGGVSTVSVELSAVSALDVTVALALSGTASGGGTDYTASGTSILIPAGSLNGAITLTSVDDALDETDETIIVDINTVTNGTESGTQQIIATIADDDASPSVTFTSAGQSQGEQHAEMTVTVKLSTLSGRDVTVPYSLGGTALEGGAADYTIPASPIVIPAGTLQQHIIITVINDSERETTETIIVTMEPPLNAAQGSIIVHTASIIDNDEPEIEVSGNDISITAGAQIPLVENATDFGRLPTTEEAISHTFSIKNTGTIDLHLTGDPIVAISGECAESYSIIAMPSPVISAGEATPFSVEFAPKGRELCQALIQINNDDADEASFDFVIQGSKDGMPWILIQILPALKQATDRNNIEN